MKLTNLRLLASAAIVALCALPVVTAAEPASPRAGFHFESVSGQSLGLWDGGKQVLVYNHGPISRPETPGARSRSCYFHPVYGLDGEVLTDDFPRDHLYHRGMYCAWPHIRIDDQEYELWSSHGELRQQFVRWLAKEADANRALLDIENGWFVGDRRLVRERVRVEIHPAAADTRSIDMAWSWTPIDQSLTLSGAEGKSYGGFNFRFGPRTKTTITVPESSMLPSGVTSTEGRVSGDLLVTKLPWVDFTGDFRPEGQLSGAAIFVHPRHPDFPPTWMTRHYGLVSVGWPGVDPQTFPANEAVTCRYRVWIHRGQRTAPEIQKAYDSFASASK